MFKKPKTTRIFALFITHFYVIFFIIFNTDETEQQQQQKLTWNSNIDCRSAYSLCGSGIEREKMRENSCIALTTTK